MKKPKEFGEFFGGVSWKKPSARMFGCSAVFL